MGRVDEVDAPIRRFRSPRHARYQRSGGAGFGWAFRKELPVSWRDVAKRSSCWMENMP